MGVSQHIPWWAKIGAKIALAKAPVSYELWRRIGIFRHGKMIDADYSRSVFDSHMKSLAKHTSTKPHSLLELGPGDSVSTAIWAHAQAIESTTLVDAGQFATSNVNAYQGALKLAGLENHPAMRSSSVDAMLRELGATYLANLLMPYFLMRFLSMSVDPNSRQQSESSTVSNAREASLAIRSTCVITSAAH